MEPRDVTFGNTVRNLILEGARKLASAVGTTLGPKGRNVALQSKYAGIRTVHDGVSVANEVHLEDANENIGATLIRQASQKTNDVSGDGTTTSAVLAYEIAKQGDLYIKSGINPMILIRGIEKATKETVNLLEKLSESVKGHPEKLIQVATVSAADSDIGSKVAEALEKVGEYGVVTVEAGTELGFNIEYKDGMEWDKGWVHPGFVLRVLDGKPNLKLEARVKEPYILITDHTITNSEELLPFLENFFMAKKKDLVIISDGLERSAMSLLGSNFERGKLNVLPVSAPLFGHHKRDALEDIAILTGGKFISKELGKKLEDVKIEDLGRADLVTSFIDSTTITGSKGDKELIKQRAEQINAQMQDAEHESEKEKFKERLAKLTAGVAVIKVGTASDAEKDEKVERVRDAIGATKAALEGGIIAGGGVALLRISEKIKTDYEIEEEKIGAKILQKALQIPVKLISENAGINGEVVINEILKQKDENYGYNVLTGKYTDLKKDGVIDPVKVTISAVQNAASVASMLLTVEASVTEKPKEEKKEI